MANRSRLTVAVSSIRWTEQLVLAALCAAEASLLWLIATAAIAAPANEPRAIAPWVPLVLIWGTALSPRILDSLDVWDPWYRLISAAAVALSLLAAVKLISFPSEELQDPGWARGAASDLIFRPSNALIPVWAVVAMVAYVWWRGRTREEPTLDTAFRLLRAGTLFALAGASTLAVTDRQRGGSDSAAAVIVFFVSALTAIGLARLISSDGAGQGEVSARSVVIALAPVALVVVIGTVLTGLLNRDLFETVLWALGPLLWGIGVVVRVIVLGVALIALLIVTPFLWLIQGREFRLRPVRLDRGNLTSDEFLREASERANATPDLIRYVIAGAVILLLFGGVTRFVLRRRDRRVRNVEAQERSRIRPLIDLQSLLDTILRALGLNKGDVVEDPLAALRGDPRWAATVAIRERYRELLTWSAERGHPRPAGSTPEEHAATLGQRLHGPGARADVATMTEIYSRARYGAGPAEVADAEAVDRAWQRFEQAARAAR
jgi:hypothetical protein